MRLGFLADITSVYIERETSECISFKSIIDDFKSSKNRKVSFKYLMIDFIY
jgi:hypothetical protein